MDKSSKTTDVLKIMSYNILYDSAGRWGAEYAWDVRAEGVYAVIRRYAPDLIGFQEVLEEQFNDLEKALPGRGAVGRHRNPDPGHTYRPWCMNPIFYNPSRLLLKNSGMVWLSECRGDGTPLIGWPESREIDRNYRHAIWGIFEDKKAGNVFFHLNTHWPVTAASAVHPYCAKLILQTLAVHAPGLPCVISGDFNQRENPFHSTGLIDAREAIGPSRTGPSGSKINRRARQVIEGAAIDHIFASPRVRIHAFDTLDDKPAGRYPSDHLPILCSFSLPFH